MLADTAGGSIQQQIKAIFRRLMKFSSGKENKLQKDAEAHDHFQNLFLSFFFVYIK